MPDGRSVSPAPGPRGGGQLLGLGRQLQRAPEPSASRGSYTSRSSSEVSGRAPQTNATSVERLQEEKKRTEALLRQAEAARATTPPRARARLDGLIDKLGELNTGLDEKLRSASQPRSASRSGSVSPGDYLSEKQRLSALQERVRATSPRLSRGEQLRLQGLMSKLETTHGELDQHVSATEQHAHVARERTSSNPAPELIL